MVTTINPKRIGLLILLVSISLILVNQFSKKIYFNLWDTRAWPIEQPRDITKSKFMQVVFRGTPEGHFREKSVLKGKIKPFKGNATPVEHVNGNTNSGYSSVTTDISVALNYATHDWQGNPCNGYLSFKEVDLNAPNIINVDDLRGLDTYYNEKEFLIRGITKGWTIVYVTNGMSVNQVLRKIRDRDFLRP